MSASWEVGGVGCTPAQKFAAVTGDTAGYEREEVRVGAFGIRIHPSYQDENGNGVQGTPVTRSVTVIGPDRDELDTTGLNSDSVVMGNAAALLVQFKVLAGSRPQQVDQRVDGSPQERIRRPQFGFDSGFAPSGDSYCLADVIDDIKSVGLQNPDFMNAAVNTVFDDFYQHNRMKSKDSCGNNQVFYFTERHFQKKKTSATIWQLILAP